MQHFEGLDMMIPNIDIFSSDKTIPNDFDAKTAS